jgi:hypothetical protein
VIRTDRRAVLFRLLLSAVLIGAISFTLWIVAPGKYFPWLLGGVVVMWLYLVGSLLRVFVTGTAFVLTERGLLAHVGDVGFVAWDEIDNARIDSSGVVETIELDLNETQAVLGRLSVLRRVLLRWYIKNGGLPSLAASFGEGGAEHLLALMRPRINPSRGDIARPVHARPSFGTPEVESETGSLLTKPFGIMFAIAAVVYVVGLGIALYVYRSRDWDWDMNLFGLIGLAALIVSFGLLPLHTGEVQVRNSTFYRRKNPIMYWGSVAIILALGLAVFLLGVGVIGSDPPTP